MLEFLNANAGALSVVFALVVAIATGFYALLTWRLVLETIRMRRTQTDPKVSVEVVPRPEWINLIDFVVENIGQGPAYEVRLEVSPDFECERGKLLSDLGLVRKGIQYLAPGQSRRTFLTNMTGDFQTKIASKFSVKVSYKAADGRAIRDLYAIDFSEFEGMQWLGEPPLYKLAKNMEKLQTTVEKVVGPYSSFRVRIEPAPVSGRRRLTLWRRDSARKRARVMRLTRQH